MKMSETTLYKNMNLSQYNQKQTYDFCAYLFGFAYHQQHIIKFKTISKFKCSIPMRRILTLLLILNA